MKFFDHTDKLRGVDPELIAVMVMGARRWAYHRRDGSFVRFTEGLRTYDRQRKLKAQGKSQTLDSYHLTGHAVDVALFPQGELTWDLDHYSDFALEHVFPCASYFGVTLTWGGEWATLRDGPHFQIEGKRRTVG